MQIRITEIIELKKRLNEINSLNLNEIEFVDDNNKTIEIDKSIKDDFIYTGLNNCDFITSGFYENGFCDK
jgi:hypothetical protein